MTSVSMSALGFAALALAAGVWVLGGRHAGNGREEKKVAPSVQIPSTIEVSDDEEDDLWEHIASILEARKRGSGHSKLSAEDDEEVWRIIEQIVAARARSHPAFQSPDKASTLSVKELRRWFESQAVERAGQSNSAKARGERGLRKPGELENEPLVEGKNGLHRQGENGVQGRGQNGHRESSYGEKISVKAVLSDEESPNSKREWAALKEAALLGNNFGRAGGEEGRDVKSKEDPLGERREVGTASTARKKSEAEAAEAAPKASKIVRRRKSIPSESDLNAMVANLDENGGQSEREKGEERKEDADERHSNGDQGKKVAVNGDTGLEQVSVSGGSEYRGPAGGEDRVVVYMTSVRAVRKTFEECATVRQIFHGFSIAVDERDISIHLPYRQEMRDLMGGRLVNVPQVFIRGKHIGGVQEVRFLADEKKMHELLVGMPRIKFTEECGGCGGGKFLPCVDCRGSRKIIVGDKVETCFACNEYGLIRCPMCA
ncbi:Glutaredoxin family protein [Klebsormidium nitens]|uniref:Glutaredoxin family protein n=1 Tax=Klebsormidium nitens TaxID=105231 RepID=A0A1Y1IS67_KLENI|nr:Glutaredoxin family protein [Klebsormidium nitens]|eukprot:GAQ92359.1 Glutaredoxin family protein [Klebsormidium nitens]